MTVLATADPNWLLSTAAQSAAALVAIVGGLLVSRLIGLEAERKTLKKQLALATEDAEQQRRALSELKTQLISDRHRAFSASIIPMLLECMDAKQPPLRLEQFQPTDRDKIKRFQELIEESSALVGQIFNTEAVYPPQLTEAATQAELRTGDARVVFEAVVAKVVETKRKRFRERPRIGNEPHTHVEPVIASGLQYDSSEAALLAAKEDLEREYRGSSMEAARLGRQLRGLPQSPTLRVPMGVLAYFALSGIVFPLTVIAVQPVKLHPGMRLAVVAAFVSGLFAVLLVFGSVLLSPQDAERRQRKEG